MNLTNYPNSVARGCGSSRGGWTEQSVFVAVCCKDTQTMLTHIRTHKPDKLTLRPEGVQREILKRSHFGFLSFSFVQLVVRAFGYALVVYLCVFLHVCVMHSFTHSMASTLDSEIKTFRLLFCVSSIGDVLLKWGKWMNIKPIRLCVSSPSAAKSGRKEQDAWFTTVILNRILSISNRLSFFGFQALLHKAAICIGSFCDVASFLLLCCSQSVSVLQREHITVCQRQNGISGMWSEVLWLQIR